ncbi:murein transglycosylase domain-containing protein [Psychromonas sp. Urea-02u-13]|uniref:murein transglycosylase domain-containing protein n=1 Tax=Psychromonas sp. Urea-02u-13 TaxID=2058326 RepID=UPI000C335945|nr:murein transglycosylase domain-containing protein [Psychromonas sp. Urea-02u-13]PKG40666.1 lytic murein transglycosylase [Psychromonas sp. Urea-02u-13]
MTRTTSTRYAIFCKKIALLIPLILMLASCSTQDWKDLSKLTNSDDAKDYAKKKGDYYKNNPQKITTDLKKIQQLFSKLEGNVREKWGDQENDFPTKQVYVKYTNQYQDKVIVNFDKNYLRVETIAQKGYLQRLQNLMVQALLAPDDPNEVDMFSDKPYKITNKEPFLYNQVKDKDNQPIRWQWRANRYAKTFVAADIKSKNANQKKVFYVEIPLVEKSQEIRSYKYASLIQQASKKYNIKESLIYAIIETESSFNPYAVSHANAYGLMQVIPSTAGKDVFNLVKKRDDQPTKQYLFNPANNIDTGTAYLHILNTRYLKGVEKERSRHYSIISAYNGGAGNVFKTFHSNRTTAVKVINQKTNQQTYDQLTQKNPIAEARHYLYKVIKFEDKFLQTHL